MKRNILKRLSVWAILLALLLTIPLLAKWPWTGMDFVFGAAMLFGAAVVYEVTTRNIFSSQRRLFVGVIVLIILAILWVGAATGFGL